MDRTLKPLFFLLGWLFFTLGLIGAFLPVLPTTPFMLLALCMFARSSARFHHWLYQHRLFGPPLQMWQEHRVISVRAKILSVSMMSISFIYMIIYSPVPAWAHLLIGSVMAYGAWFVLSRKSRIPEAFQLEGETAS